MKRMMWIVLCGLTLVGLLASVAFGAEGPYVGIQAGATWLEDVDGDGVEIEFDTGFNLGAAVGYDFGITRLEGAVAYRKNDVDEIAVDGIGSFSADGDGRAVSFLVNGYLDIENQTSYTPYLGGGIGIAIVSVDSLEVADVEILDDDDTVFAYQLTAGVGYELVEDVILDLNYHYFATDDPEFEDEFGGKGEVDIETHNVSLGLRWAF